MCAAQQMQQPHSAPPARAEDWSIIGHEAAIEGLRRSIRQRRTPHAYLFAGPPNVGKTAVALAFSQALCCQSTARADISVPCGECLSCRKIARGVHPDVELFDLAGQAANADSSGGKNTTMTIDTIRRVAGATVLKPLEAPRRIVIVDDAETMQEVAQEALLKTLEEPPSSVTMILLADEIEVLLPTIQSRCRVTRFGMVPSRAVEQALTAAGQATSSAKEIAALSYGRPGWALKAMAEPALVVGQMATIDRGLAWIESGAYDRLVTGVRLGDTFQKRRGETLSDLETLLRLWRDVMLLRVGLDRFVTHPAVAERLSSLARGLDVHGVRRAVQSVQRCISDLHMNVRPRLAIEAMVLQWPNCSQPA